MTVYDNPVTWHQWDETGVIAYGNMSYPDAMKEMQEFELEAKKVLEETGADHVVYGSRKLTVYGWEVNYYMIPMSDERFYKDIWRIKDRLIYALHKRK